MGLGSDHEEEGQQVGHLFGHFCLSSSSVSICLLFKLIDFGLSDL